MKKRHYSPQQKAHAILALQHYNGDVPKVSHLLNIPIRTLYDWRKELETGKYPHDSQKNFAPQPPHIPQDSQTSQPTASYSAAFGMTHEELKKAMEFEYVQHPYEDLRKALMADIQKLQLSIAEDPDSAHIRSLAVSRMLGDVLHLDQMCRIHKPQLSIIKYEFPDGTFHDVPPWSNVIHNRAISAYWAVIEEAKRQHEEQQAALKASAALEQEETRFNPVNEPAYPYKMEEDEDWLLSQMSAEEIIAMPFRPEDFVPKHTGILKHFLGEDPSPRPKNADYFSKDEDNEPPYSPSLR